jgi:hypothetical protein
MPARRYFWRLRHSSASRYCSDREFCRSAILNISVFLRKTAF